MSKQKDLINQMYDDQLESQKSQLEQDYNQSLADLNEQQIKQQRATDTSLNRTAVESAQAKRNNAEVQNAYGLSSGAMAQSSMAYDNTRLANMTALRAQQNEADAQIERQRGILASQYAAAIREAQANNDFERAKQLLVLARQEESRLAAQRASGGGYVSSVTGNSGPEEAGENGSGVTSGAGNRTYNPNALVDFTKARGYVYTDPNVEKLLQEAYKRTQNR